MKRVALTFAGTSALAVAGFVAATVGLAGGSKSDPRAGPSSDAVLDAATSAVRTPAVADPRGGPPWVIREYQTTDGRHCAKPGRQLGAEVGSLRARSDGRGYDAVGTSIGEGGDCVDVDAIPEGAPLAWHIASDQHDPSTGQRRPVSYIWGLARPEVNRINIQTRSGSTTAAVTAGHAFIAVLGGDVAADEVTLEAVLGDDSSRTITVPRPSDTVRDLILHPPSGDEIAREDPRR